MKRWKVTACSLAVIICVLVPWSVVVTQSLYTVRTIFNKVYDRQNNVLKLNAWSGPSAADPFLTETEVLNKVFDPVNNILKTDGGGGSGDVTVSGTPTAGQIAIWTDADTIEGNSSLVVDILNTGVNVSSSGNVTCDGRIEWVTTGASTITRTLPAASSGTTLRRCRIYKVDNGAGTLTIARAGSNTLEPNAVTSKSTGTQWTGFDISEASATQWFVLSDITMVDLAGDVTGLLAGSHGGTGIDTTGLSGIPSLTSGVWSITLTPTIQDLTLSDTTPTLKLTDTTASAKSLTIAVDANVAEIREDAGAAGSLLSLDLANNRLGLLTSAPTHTSTQGSTSTGSAWYNTSDQVTNYERVIARWSSNLFDIIGEKGGTGSNRNIRMVDSAGFGFQTNGTSSASVTLIGNTGGASLVTASAVGIELRGGVTSGTTHSGIRLASSGTYTATSSAQIHSDTVSTFAPTTGSATFAAFQVNTTVNQTGGASGVSRAVYINPTITAAVDFRALETSAGKTVLASHVESQGTAPAISGSCGTSPSIVGTDVAGKLTTGTVAPTSCTLTFATAWVNAPACVAVNETTSNLVKAVSTTTTVVLSGTFVASDVLAYVCIGRL